MAEPLKNLLSREIIADMASCFHAHWHEFDYKGFISLATEDLDSLELKERTDQITDAMIEFFPDDFEKAGDILLKSLGSPLDANISTETVDANGIVGWAVMPMTRYVGLCGHEHFDLSMTLLKEMTKRSSSEFGIRFFLSKTPEKTLKVLKSWTNDKDQHVRRLVSEGTRPRLPWAARLSIFIEDPFPVIELLELLKDDDKEYVRRSVANNLNDISKDHPELVADIASRWLKDAGQKRKSLVRHACRTLIKNGHTGILKALGYNSPKIKNVKIDIVTSRVTLGDYLKFNVSICSSSSHDQALLIDYVIHHKKSNGSLTPKLFKWRTITMKAGESLVMTRKHAIKKITTRVYYPGIHALEVMVNGVSMGTANFTLEIS